MTASAPGRWSKTSTFFEMADLVLVKLGGSLITDKRGDCAPRLEVIERLAREIAVALPRMHEQVVLGHGSGSFGHASAARHGIGSGPLDAVAPRARPGVSALAGVSETRAKAAELHALVTSSLLAAGLAPFTWAPSSALVARAGVPSRGAIEPLLATLEFGLLPVTYGDVVTDRRWGASICSTEAVLRYLAGRLQRRGHRVRRVLWLGATAGIYDPRGVAVPRVDRDNYARVRRMIGATDGTDVTGGMLLRLDTARALARRGVESWIIDGRIPELLTAGLLGEKLPLDGSGTRFVAD